MNCSYDCMFFTPYSEIGRDGRRKIVIFFKKKRYNELLEYKYRYSTGLTRNQAILIKFFGISQIEIPFYFSNQSDSRLKGHLKKA